jgi:hypothetical protein
MTTDRDRLDEAIDIVARRLTRVDDDSRLAARIAASLPERRHWLGGLTWRLAAIALVATASGILLQRSSDRSTQVLRSDGSARFVEFAQAITPQTALGAGIVHRTFVARPLNLRRTAGDHDRALASLALAPLADEPVLEDGLLRVEPLAIVSLPLATESLSLPE